MTSVHWGYIRWQNAMHGRLFARKDAGGVGSLQHGIRRLCQDTCSRGSVVPLSPVPYIVGQLLREHIYPQGIEVS